MTDTSNVVVDVSPTITRDKDDDAKSGDRRPQRRSEAGASREERDAWYREQDLPPALKGSPVALCLSFTPVPLRGDAPADVPRSEGRRFVHLYFLEGESPAAWDAHFAGHAAALAGTGLGRLLWASPFRPTLPGTDTYTDQLW